MTEEEYFDVVNDRDEVVGRETRTEAHRLGRQHRGVHVFLFTEDDKLLIQQRSAKLTLAASEWDASIAEHVQAGETYEEAAARGLREELGLESVELEPLAKIQMTHAPNDHEICRIYRGRVARHQVQLNREEVDNIAFHSIDELNAMMNSRDTKFCSWFVELLKWYAHQPAGLVVLQTL